MEETKQWDGWSAAGSDRQGGRRRPPLKGGFHPLSSSLSLSLSLLSSRGKETAEKFKQGIERRKQTSRPFN